MAISAVDAITPAIEHTRQQLFTKFRIGQWTRLAFVGLLAGELGANGCNRSAFQLPTHPPVGDHPQIPGIDPQMLAALAAIGVILVIAALAIGIILTYVSSVMRFVLFDSVLTRECHVRWGWSQRLTPGWRYFVWKVLYGLLSLAGIAVLVAVFAAIAFANGWLKQPRAHIPQLILIGLIPLFLILGFALVTAIVFVLTKDFVIPQMALENIDVMEGWRRLWALIQAETGAYIGYIAMKIVLAIVAGILIMIAALIVGLVFVIPTAGLSILAILTGKAAGLTWNAHTITLAIVVGTILLSAFLYLISLISVPAIVFFLAYSMYFFAGRYPRLSALLYRTPPAPDLRSSPTPAAL